MTTEQRLTAEREAEIRWFYKFDKSVLLLLTELDAVRKELDEAYNRCAQIAANPYSDAVAAFGSDEPSEVGRKIAAAIRAARRRTVGRERS